MRRPRRTLAIAVVAAVGIVAGGCGGSDAGTTAASSPAAPPVIPSAAGEPGTPLGDGFTVVDGTTLVGDPIPIGVAGSYDGEPVVDDGWTATSVVDGGDPVEIVDAYMAQAERAGLADRARTGCAHDREVVTCSASARSPDGSPPRSVSAVVVRGRQGDVLSDHVVVRYSTTHLYRDYTHDRATGDADPDVGVPPPTSWPPLAAVGEPLGTAGETTRAVVVHDGSRLAAPAHLNLDDTTGGIVALLEVTGDPSTVFQAYLDDLVDSGLDAPPPEAVEVGDATVTSASLSEAGGDHFSLTLVERPGRPSWLVVEGSHD